MGHRDFSCAVHTPYVDALHDQLHTETPDPSLELAQQQRAVRLAYHQVQIRTCLARGLRMCVSDGKVTMIRDAAGFLPDACDYDDTDEADVALARLAANSTDRAAIGEAYLALFNLVLAHAAGDMVAVEDRGGSVRYEMTA
jgi:hypothetical protein